MKKNVAGLLIVILVAVQMWSIADLRRQIQQLDRQVGYLEDRLGRQIAEIYHNVDHRLEREASLLASHEVRIGELDTAQKTVPLTFTLTPKELGPQTTVSLDFDGRLIAMDRQGTGFTATVHRDLLGQALPEIIISDQGRQKITREPGFGVADLKEHIFPRLWVHFAGNRRFDDDSLSLNGGLRAEVKETGVVVFTDLQLIYRLDGQKTRSRHLTPGELQAGYELREDLSLSAGQVFELLVVATDSLGFEHHYTAIHHVGGSREQREPTGDQERIYSAAGELLWESRW